LFVSVVVAVKDDGQMFRDVAVHGDPGGKVALVHAETARGAS